MTVPQEDAPAAKPNRAGCWIILGLFAAVSVVPLVHDAIYPPKPPTPGDIQAGKAALEAVQEAQIRAKDARALGTALCQQKMICAKLPDIRQECATAGNFDNCIKVKIGDEDYSSVAYCNHGGDLAYTPENMPSPLVCWMRNHGFD
jgi:hypothetical protein